MRNSGENRSRRKSKGYGRVTEKEGKKMRRISRLIRIIRTKLAQYFTDKDYEHADKWERHVADRIMELSDYRFKVEFTGFGAGVSGKFEDKRSETEQAKAALDLLIKFNDKPLAVVEVTTGRKRTWEQSRFFPIATHKINRARKQPLPAYIVYLLTKEDPALEFWLLTETIATFEHGDMMVYIHGEPVSIDNYVVPKHEWNRGLEGLVNELQQREVNR